jgi:hypothetical protein
VLLRSPEQHSGTGSSYRNQNGKGIDLKALPLTVQKWSDACFIVADLQNLAATATGYYDHSNQMHQGSNGGYGQTHHGAHNGYYAPQQQNSYGGPVYYGVSHGGDMGHQAAYDNKKRGYEALNDFFGDVKRRQFDPNSSAQVGQRLMALHGIPIHNGTLPEYIPSPSMVAVGGHGQASSLGLHQPHYALPIPNLRTKNDLVSMDNFLDQISATVYESSTSAAAAGVQLPSTHYFHRNMAYRQSVSPPQTAIPNHLVSMGPQVSAATATAPSMVARSSHSPPTGTPALTPPSSSLSYTSGHSPISVHGLSPSSRHSSAASAMYPTLPAVSSGYQTHSSGAPVSTLGPSFDLDPPRRFSGGMLQRSAGPRSIDEMDVDDASISTSKESTPQVSSREVDSKGVSASLIDPALSSLSSPGQQSDSDESARDRAEEIWVENMRVIEALKNLIHDRLENHQYEDDTEKTDNEDMNDEGKEIAIEGNTKRIDDHESLYPKLRAALDAST